MPRASAPVAAQIPPAPVAAKDDVAWDEDEDEKLSRQDLSVLHVYATITLVLHLYAPPLGLIC
jgi:hypothetical protein